MRFSYSLALRRDRRGALGPVEGLAAGEELAVDRGRGGDAQRVALAAPYRHAVAERGPLGVVQLGGAEEVGDLAGHVEGDGQFRGRGAFVDCDVLGHEVGDGRANGAAADAVLAGQGGDGLAVEVCRARRRSSCP